MHPRFRQTKQFGSVFVDCGSFFLIITLLGQTRMVALLKDIYSLHGFSGMHKEGKVMVLLNYKPQFQFCISKSRVAITVQKWNDGIKPQSLTHGSRHAICVILW